MTHAATHSNETMKRVDKFKQLLEIQENISGGPDLVSPTRQLIKQGKISKISARGGDHQERYLFLVSGEAGRCKLFHQPHGSCWLLVCALFIMSNVQSVYPGKRL